MTGVHGGEARFLHLAPKGGGSHHGVLRQGADSWANRTPPASPPAVCAPPLRPAATPHGTPPALAFIKRHGNGATLCIPTAYCSYSGETRWIRRLRCCAPARHWAMPLNEADEVHIAPVRQRTRSSACITLAARNRSTSSLIIELLPERAPRPGPDRAHPFRRDSSRQAPAAGRPLFRLHQATRILNYMKRRGTRNCGDWESRPRPATTKWRPAQFELAPVFEEREPA